MTREYTGTTVPVVQKIYITPYSILRSFTKIKIHLLAVVVRISIHYVHVVAPVHTCSTYVVLSTVHVPGTSTAVHSCGTSTVVSCSL